MTALDARAERRRQDLEKLRALAERSSSRISLEAHRGSPMNQVELLLLFRTAPSDEYPRRVLSETRLHLQLAARYPFEEPIATLSPVVFHPNVYPSGRICLGARWLPTDGLDLLVRRIVQIVVFAPEVLNLASPANLDAARWYRQAKAKSPGAFPSDTASLEPPAPRPTLSWSDVPPR